MKINTMTKIALEVPENQETIKVAKNTTKTGFGQPRKVAKKNNGKIGYHHFLSLQYDCGTFSVFLLLLFLLS